MNNKQKTSLTRLQVLEIKRLRNEGLTTDEIAKKLDRTPMTIYRWIKRLREAGHEIKRFPRGKKKMDL